MVKKGMIDASHLSIDQIRFLNQSEQHMFMKLDFACCNDNFICEAVGIMHCNSTSVSCIPLSYRRSAKCVKEFFWLSRDARIRLEKEDGEYLFGHNMPIEYNTCLGLVRSIMGIGKNVVWGEEEDIGYDSLIRSSIHYKAKMLKENTYLEQGLLLSGEAKYVLVELYSGQIQKRYQDIKQYDRYAFASSNCQSPPDGELICTNCATIRKPLRRLCRSRYEQNSKSINKNTKTTLLELASPSKLTEKIDMVVDDLRSVRKSNRYLKSCLEEKRVKHGIVMKTEQSCVLFDEDAEVEAMKVIGSNGELKAGKRLLARLLWNQSVLAT